MISQGDEVTFQRRGGVSVDVEDVEAKYLRLLGKEILYFFRPCFFSEAKKVKERFKVVVVGGGSDRWASPASVYP